MKKLLFIMIACISGALFAFSAAGAEVVPGHGDNCWWCHREDFNLMDPAQVWKYLTADVTVLNVDEKTPVYLLDSPEGKRLKTREYEGFFYGASASVHVISQDGKWALIEAYDMRNQLTRGYVRASLLKTTTPSPLYGMVVDKQTQRLHLYQDGNEITQLLISTGLPGKDTPFNETASGEFLIVSWTGGFWSGNMFCDLALRFNGGDLLHLVPAKKGKDDSWNYAPFEPLLGTRASHGCIRVQRELSAEGINMKWLWDNLKRNTKLIVWDDTDRPMFYPSDNLELYYNPTGGQNYHMDQYCSKVKDRWLPLAAMQYIELRSGSFAKLTACSGCVPEAFATPAEIDAINLSRGFTPEQAMAIQESQMQGVPLTLGPATPSLEAEDTVGDNSASVMTIVDDIITFEDEGE